MQAKKKKQKRMQEVETKKSIAFSGAPNSIVPLVVSKLQKNSVMLSVAFVNSFVFHVIHVIFLYLTTIWNYKETIFDVCFVLYQCSNCVQETIVTSKNIVFTF